MLLSLMFCSLYGAGWGFVFISEMYGVRTTESSVWSYKLNRAAG